jgi:hypothetical protein
MLPPTKLEAFQQAKSNLCGGLTPCLPARSVAYQLPLRSKTLAAATVGAATVTRASAVVARMKLVGTRTSVKRQQGDESDQVQADI